MPMELHRVDVVVKARVIEVRRPANLPGTDVFNGVLGLL